MRKKRQVENSNDIIYVSFQLSHHDLPSEIDDSTLRLMVKSHSTVICSTNYFSCHGAHSTTSVDKVKRKDNINKSLSKIITLIIYQLIEPYTRKILLDKRILQLEHNHPTSNWVELDVSRAVENWASERTNCEFEIYCEGCSTNNMHIVHEASMFLELPEYNPVLNVVGNVIHREKRSRQHHHLMQTGRRKPRVTDCSQENRNCCRHTMNVVFKEIKGFEFIIQPKNFDAGYCRGKCPPRYNPAHHHALLQSMIWKQDKSKAPRPCCAPSKLLELEVLHVDESDKSKLKVSTWSDMKVLECACS